MRNVVVVHYHEIGLKGRNRSMFEKALGTNLKDATRGLGRESVERLPGRVIVRTPEPPSSDLLDAVGRTFGVAAYAPAVEIAADMNVMASTALELLSGRTFETFAIAARRATKELPFTSRDINVRLGDVVREATGTRVDLSHPGVTVHVDVVGKKALMYADRFRGPGGLPVGVSGHVMSLLSGGIDSPVATWRMMRRGARVSLCHFHSYPFTDKASVRKAVELGNILARWQGNTTIYLVPFGHAQQEIVTAVPPALRVIIYRRFMMRVAAELAAQSGAGALVTGESLGQVASQTLENMACTEDASTLPVFRPLVGNDKQEIVAEAQRIGTFETSILPYEDCCTLFVPRSPATRATLEECARAEASLDVTNIVQRLVKETEQEHLSREREDA